MNRIFLPLIALLVFNSSQAQNVKKINWEKDIKTLQKKLPDKHRYLFYLRTRAEFNRDIESLLAKQKNISDLGVALKMQQIICRLGDSHTGLSWGIFNDKNKRLPIKLYWFEDGIYVIQTITENKVLLGKKITKINDTSINTVVDSLSTLIVNDNAASVKNKVPSLIPETSLLKHFNFVSDNVITIETEDQQGKTERFSIKPAELNIDNVVNCNADSTAFTSKKHKEFFIDRYFEEEGIYYIQYNLCYSKEFPPYKYKGDINSLPSFAEFESRVIETLKNKTINKLIVDLRFNAGGNSFQGTKFIQNLSQIEKINKKGVLYVVIGRNTFSSAILNIMDFKRLTKPIIVGEETSGKPNHFGSVKIFKLPSSKISVAYSTRFFRRVEKDEKTISPEVKIETRFQDYMSGIDPVYEWIKNN